MLRRQDEYVLVKRRDKDPEKAIHHYGGDIWGGIEFVDSLATITFYFGAMCQDIEYDPVGFDLYNTIGQQEYRLPASRMLALGAEIELNIAEEREFDGLLREADCTPLQASFLELSSTENE